MLKSVLNKKDLGWVACFVNHPTGWFLLMMVLRFPANLIESIQSKEQQEVGLPGNQKSFTKVD